MKYIDAEKLIAKIWEICDYASEHWDVEKERGAYDFAKRLTDFIDSLQQEQPDKYETALEKAREWMPNVNQGGHAMLIDIFPELEEGLDPRYGGRKQEHPEVDLFECPVTPIKDAIEVTSRMQHIDDDIKPIAEFILDYASWNLHKDEWNQPVIEVPLFRVLDALAQRGKPYCCAG